MTRRASRSSRSRKKPPNAPLIQLTPTQRSWIAGLALLAIALVTFLSLISRNRGALTGMWLSFLHQMLGWGAWGVPLGLAVLGIWILTIESDTPLYLPWTRLLGVFILFITGLGLTHHFIEDPLAAATMGRGGGQLGYGASYVLTYALGWAGATVVMVAIAGMGLTLAFDVSLRQVIGDTIAMVRDIWGWFRGWWLALRTRPRRISPRGARGSSDTVINAPPPEQARPQPVINVGNKPSREQPRGRRDASRVPSLPTEIEDVPTAPPPDLSPATVGEGVQWVLPRVEDTLAESNESQMSLSDIREKTRIIEETLHSLGVPVTVIEVNPGPVVTQFGIEPGYIEQRNRQGGTKRVKVKISRISALANDLALALAASPIRIEAPVPGKGIVGLEIPNSEVAVVGLRGVIESEEFDELASKMGIALGRDVSGAAVVEDLPKLPHLLIAGATGSGKSVCINALIACLLCHNTPDDLRLLMIDPKRVELSTYNGIPHLIAPVVVEPERVVTVLRWVTSEMERRYKVFARVGARNIESYNQLARDRAESKLPYIVVFIDELADLMMVAPDDVEREVCRIAQMARATGMHLVIATQRPSVDVVTGLIKANFPARISFAVSSQVDSRVIIDVPGADKLLGRGDALYMAPDSPKLQRIQGCWVSDGELHRLVSFWKAQGARVRNTSVGQTALPLGTPMVQRPLWPQPVEEREMPPDEDPLLREAIALVIDQQRASVSFLQRCLRIGYTRASRLIDILEEQEIVGPPTGSSKAREVLVQIEDTDEESEENGEIETIDGIEP